MSPKHRMKIDQQKFQYVFLKFSFDKVHFQRIETPFVQCLQSVKKIVGPKSNTLTLMVYDYVVFFRKFSAIFVDPSNSRCFFFLFVFFCCANTRKFWSKHGKKLRPQQYADCDDGLGPCSLVEP